MCLYFSREKRHEEAETAAAAADSSSDLADEAAARPSSRLVMRQSGQPEMRESAASFRPMSSRRRKSSPVVGRIEMININVLVAYSRLEVQQVLNEGSGSFSRNVQDYKPEQANDKYINVKYSRL